MNRESRDSFTCSSSSSSRSKQQRLTAQLPHLANLLVGPLLASHYIIKRTRENLTVFFASSGFQRSAEKIRQTAKCFRQISAGRFSSPSGKFRKGKRNKFDGLKNVVVMK